MRKLLHLPTITIVALALLVISALLSAPVLAQESNLTRAEAVEIAKQRSGNGRVLGVKEVVGSDGVTTFDVKVITNGRVRVYSIPESQK